MKKIILFILLLSGILFADELKGVYGINFDDSVKTVKEKIIKRGYTECEPVEDAYISDYIKDDKIIAYEKENGTYGGESFPTITFIFNPNDTLGEIILKSDGEDFDYASFFEKLIFIYGLTEVDKHELGDFYSATFYNDQNDNLIAFIYCCGDIEIIYRSSTMNTFVKLCELREALHSFESFADDL